MPSVFAATTADAPAAGTTIAAEPTGNAPRPSISIESTANHGGRRKACERGKTPACAAVAREASERPKTRAEEMHASGVWVTEGIRGFLKEKDTRRDQRRRLENREIAGSAERRTRAGAERGPSEGGDLSAVCQFVNEA
ncbi:MAG: hypothetical protein IPH76_17295 [Xanthomonadales bacterium]|nr:hypothetical protein [Xanthomonadales bacterium]